MQDITELINSSLSLNKVAYNLKFINHDKIKLKGKLSLNKETIAKLNDEQMSNVIGGELSPGSAARNTCIAATCVGSGGTGCESQDSPKSCRFCD